MRYLAILLLATLPTTASALCPRPEPKLCSRWFESDTVVVGTLLDQRKIEARHPQDDDRLAYRVRVEKTLKGRVPPLWIATSVDASARWVGDPGRRYVFFARNGSLEGSCSALDAPAYVHRIDAELRQLRRRTAARIEGRVIGRPASPVLVAVSSGRRISLPVSPTGDFAATLPPGSWRLQMDGVRPTAYSAEPGRPFRLQPGQCAQFELEPGL